MFKKGDVVTYCGRTEDAGFDVLVTSVDTPRIDEFLGVIVHANAGSYFEEHSDAKGSWDVKQFKLKQQTAVSSNTADNAFPVLKDGMVVETRRGRIYVVCGDKFLRPNGFQWKRDYSTEGRTGRSESDIVKVWSGIGLFGLNLELYTEGHADEIIWKEKKNADKIASLRSQVDSLQEQIKQLEEEDNV